MSSFPCVSDFRTPFDELPRWAHCSGKVNVTVRGDAWTVDFDNDAEITGSDEYVSFSLADEIIEKAIRMFEEDA